jgi:2',3'-cyclic-nucleotide 2'-phosphodiesterase (5'-nucleotidase family)
VRSAVFFQAYCYSKYVGRFDLYFDAEGELKVPVDSVGVKNARPVLLDKSVGKDQTVLDMIEEYRPNMTDYTSTVGVLEARSRFYETVAAVICG